MMEQTKELRVQLHNLLKQEIGESSIDEVAEKYGINKTDRVTLLKDEYDGKLSKFIEIVNAKGLQIVLKDPKAEDAPNPLTELVDELKKDKETLESDIDTLNKTLLERNDEVKQLKEELIVAREKKSDTVNDTVKDVDATQYKTIAEYEKMVETFEKRIEELVNSKKNGKTKSKFFNREKPLMFPPKKKRGGEFYDSDFYGKSVK